MKIQPSSAQFQPAGQPSVESSQAEVKTSSPADHLRPLDLNSDNIVTIKEAEIGMYRAGFTAIDSKLVAQIAVRGVGGTQGHATHVDLAELDQKKGFHGSSANAIDKMENLEKVFAGKTHLTEKEIIQGIHERLHLPEGDKPAGFTADETKDLAAAYGEWHFLFLAKGENIPGVDEKVLTLETAKAAIKGNIFNPVRGDRELSDLPGPLGAAVDGINMLREGSDFLTTGGKIISGAVKENVGLLWKKITD